MRQSRSAGVLCHLSCLPSAFGIGDCGSEAYKFIDFLHQSGQTLWQFLPIGPTGYGNSPYSAYSAFAGNHLFISPEILFQKNLIDSETLTSIYGDNSEGHSSSSAIDFNTIISQKKQVLRHAFEQFQRSKELDTHARFHKFCRKNNFWLKNYAEFMALKDHFGQKPWIEWPKEFRTRQKKSLTTFAKTHNSDIEFYKWTQFELTEEWSALRKAASLKGIDFIGDIPIFVAYDSADVWSRPEEFQLTYELHPKVVAGVPPDYFSPTGQRWGNPHYNWDMMKGNNFSWWIQRFRILSTYFSRVRIDHFRGFVACWEIPARSKTAIKGRWKKVPGHELFAAVHEQFSNLQIIAEDLGIITDEVHRLRHAFGFPGMRVLQFGLGSGDRKNYFLPHNFAEPTITGDESSRNDRSVVYTGTHDNDTTLGWWNSLSDSQKQFAKSYIPSQSTVSHGLIELALSSTAEIAIVPIQDILSLGSEARMNIPGKPDGNWTWRLSEGMLTNKHIEFLRHLVQTYNR